MPENVIASQNVPLRIAHHFADTENEQAITVTLLRGAGKDRIERKVVKAKGDGEASLSFAVPADVAGQNVKFAAFVGEDFKATPQHIQSATMKVK